MEPATPSCTNNMVSVEAWNVLRSGLGLGDGGSVPMEGLTNRELNTQLDAIQAAADGQIEAQVPADCGKILLRLCEQATTRDNAIKGKIPMFLAFVMSKYQVMYSDEELFGITPILLEIQKSSVAWIGIEALRALGNISYENGPRLAQQLTLFLHQLLPLAESTEEGEMESTRLALVCLGNLCHHGSNICTALYAPLMRASMAQLQHHVPNLLGGSAHSLEVLVVTASLRAIHAIILEGKTVHIPSMPVLTPHLSRLLVCGLVLPSHYIHLHEGGNSATTSQNTSSVSAGGMVSPAAAAAPLPHGEISRAASTGFVTSDSESESESGRGRRGPTGSASKVRLHAVMCIQALAQRTGKQLYGYWSLLLPDATVGVRPNLLACLLHDPAPRIRLAVTAALQSLFEGSRLFLSAAEDKQPTTLKHETAASSFTPRSMTLALLIRELHQSLMVALLSEGDRATLCGILRVVGTIAVNVPYDRLPQGYVPILVEKCHHFMLHRDVSVSREAISALGHIFTAKCNMHDIAPSLLMVLPDPSGAQSVLQGLFRLLQETTDDNIRMEATIAVTKLAHHYPILARNFCDIYLSVAVSQGTSPTDAIRVATLKLCDELIAQMTTSPWCDSEVIHFDQVLPSVRFLILQVYLPAMSDALPLVRASVVAVLSLVPSPFLAALEQDTAASSAKEGEKEGEQGSYLPGSSSGSSRTASKCLLPLQSLVMSSVHDAHHILRATAARTLGVLISTPVFRTDDFFVANAARSLCQLLGEDPNMTVRIRACWALANLFDVLALLVEGGTGTKIDAGQSISVSLFQDIVRTGVKAAQDSDKVRASAMRLLGNAMRWRPNDTEMLQMVAAAVNSNIHVNNAKVQWNACYAAASLLLHSRRTESEGEEAWKIQMLKLLTREVKDCKNFKVRINAALALSMPENRLDYGSEYVAVWEGVMRSVERLDEMEEFSELRYRETLSAQLVDTLCHLIVVATRGDFTPLKDLLFAQAEALYHLLEARLKGEKKAPPSGTSTQTPAELQLDEGGACFAVPLKTRSVDSLTAFVALTKLYESHIKTIPLSTLQKFQSRAFPEE
jgi:HEAT repeat-containing protein 6